MNPLSSKVHFLAQTRQTRRRTNRTENHHEQTTKSDFGARVSRMRRRFSALSAGEKNSSVFLCACSDLNCIENSKRAKLSFFFVHIRPSSYVAFSELNSTEMQRLYRLPHFCRTFDWSCRIIRQKCGTDSNVDSLRVESNSHIMLMY